MIIRGKEKEWLRIYVMRQGKGFTAGNCYGYEDGSLKIDIIDEGLFHFFDPKTGECLTDNVYKIDKESLRQLVELLNG